VIKGDKSLYPFQKAGLEYIEKHNGRVLLADEPGLGKTIQSIAYLEKHPKKRPVLVVPPATLKINWSEEIDKWLSVNKEVYVLNGTTNLDDLPDADIYIANYSILYSRIKNLIDIKPQVLIMDESHNIRNIDTKKTQSIFGLASKDKNKAIKNLKKTIEEDIKKQRTKAKEKIQEIREKDKAKKEDEKKIDKINKKAESEIKELKQKKHTIKKLHDIRIPHIISLSGTPIVNKPREIFSNLTLLRPELFDNFFWFGKRYCDGKKTKYGWDFDGASNLDLLNEKLRDTVMVRRLKTNVLEDLPNKTRTTIKVDITNKQKYKNAENHFIEWLESINPEKAKKAKKAEALTKINYLKKLSIQGKISSVKNWIDDFIYSDQKLIIFAHHQKTIKLLKKKYGDIAVSLSGSDTEKSRDKAVKGL
jgi:SNF2 family DNA or RNA helicase